MHVSFTILYNYDICTSILDLALGRVLFFYHYIIMKGICNACNLYFDSAPGRVRFSNHYLIMKEIIYVTFIDLVPELVIRRRYAMHVILILYANI